MYKWNEKWGICEMRIGTVGSKGCEKWGMWEIGNVRNCKRGQWQMWERSKKSGVENEKLDVGN